MSAQSLPLLPVEPAQPVRTGRPGCGELTASDGRSLPLKGLTVDTVIVGMTASSTVRQRFVNDGDTAIEATYVFPLPARAGVTDFAADLAGRRVVGVLKERGEARADYEQALVSGQRAAIVEEDRPDVFSVRVGNLGAGEEATIEMRLTGPLSFEDGEATFRFPLVVAPRYTTGRPVPGDQTGAGDAVDTDAVPDASRVTPPRLVDDDERPDLQISVSIDGAGLAVSELRSSLATVVGDGGLLRVESGARADRDFVLRFRVDRSELASSALLVPDHDGDEGTWSVTLVPPVEVTTAPRDVVVLLDRSGSMHGWKMIAARRAAGRIVDMLDAGDRFCVLAFDDRIDTPKHMSRDFEGLVPASDRNRFAASSWLGSLESRGGTAIAEPLYKAVEMLATSCEDRQASVVLVTDGQISGEDHLLRTLAPAVGRTRIHCVGIDQAVNAGMLDRLARLGSGRCELVESEERLDEAMARLARTIGRPALTSLRVGAEGVSIVEDSVTPSLLPDAFAGVPWVISGRYRGTGDAAFRVDADGFTATLPARVAPEAIAVRTIWARSVVRDLEDDYASYPSDDDELAQRLVAHSVRFGVLSRFTAFVAIDPERTDAGPRESLTELIQPVEQPSGWATNVGFAPATRSYAMPAPAMMAAPPPSGRPPMFAGAAPAGPPPTQSAPPRPLDKLLKEVAKGTQVRRSGLDAVLDELKQHRDVASDVELRTALNQLCAALTQFLEHPTGPRSRQLMVAVDAVRRALAGVGKPAKRRFWR